MCSGGEYNHTTFEPYYFGFRCIRLPVNALSKKKHMMSRVMRKSRELKLRRYAAILVNLNEYFSALLGEKASDKIGETDINEIIFYSMPNEWSKQVYVKGFDCKTITFKNMLIGLNVWKLWNFL